MTEKSYPWGGLVTGDATLAPYDDDEWSDLWQLLFTARRAYQGVIYTTHSSFSGCLAVTNPAGDTIRVATGAAIVDGKVYTNDANIDTAIAVNGVYNVVLRKDFAAQTVRVVIKVGAATQVDGVTWEISLATATRAAGVWTIVDNRGYLAPPYKHIWVPATYGWDDTGGVVIDIAQNTLFSAVSLPDATDARAIGKVHIPYDFGGKLKLYPVILGMGNGNAYVCNELNFGGSGEDWNAHTESSLYGAQAVTLLQITRYEDSFPNSEITVDDFLVLYFHRDSTNPADTIGGALMVFGWDLYYEPRY